MQAAQCKWHNKMLRRLRWRRARCPQLGIVRRLRANGKNFGATNLVLLVFSGVPKFTTEVSANPDFGCKSRRSEARSGNGRLGR